MLALWRIRVQQQAACYTARHAPRHASHLPPHPLLLQWVYDAWYRHMTPDREFPAEVRLLLSHMFGELAGRARAVDWRQLLLEQLPELLTHNIQQYRWAGRMVRCCAAVRSSCWSQCR